MAHTKQARKRIRQNEVNNEKNRTERSRMRTAVKKAETDIAAADKKAVAVSFKAAMSELHKAARKGLVKKAAAARKISRLAARLRAAS